VRLPVSDDCERAVAKLRAGGLVAIPTETVYGLGASIERPSAIARVYAVKGRPADHPLIVHIDGAAELDRLSASTPAYALALAAAFWPGPLTLVLRRTSAVGAFVTGGQDTVAIRVPDHPLTLAILRVLGTGVAAPSANRFGRVSPTTAAHVLAELGSLLDPQRDLIVDGGPARVGVESTIVDCTGASPRMLRSGGVSSADVQRVTGLELGEPDAGIRAPGALASHYAPSASVRVVAGPGAAQLVGADPLVGLIAPGRVATPVGVVRLLAPATVGEYAAGLYAALREADALGLQEVRAIAPAGDGLAAAIRDRLGRAEVGSSAQDRTEP